MIKHAKQHAKSKTQWFNVAVFAAGVVSIIEQNAHFLQAHFGDTGYGLFLMGIGILGFALRWMTKEPISAK